MSGQDSSQSSSSDSSECDQGSSTDTRPSTEEAKSASSNSTDLVAKSNLHRDSTDEDDEDDNLIDDDDAAEIQGSNQKQDFAQMDGKMTNSPLKSTSAANNSANSYGISDWLSSMSLQSNTSIGLNDCKKQTRPRCENSLSKENVKSTLQKTTKKEDFLSCQVPVRGRSKDNEGGKQIRRIKTFAELQQETRSAVRAERERRKRVDINERERKKLFPDSATQVVLDFDRKTKQVLVQIDPAFVRLLKPHQIDGIRFLYNCSIETIDRLQKDSTGSGCILAHSMGLGKTLQVIAFLHSIFTNQQISEKIRRILIVIPYNVNENWGAEFDKWLSKCRSVESIPRRNIYEMRTAKSTESRLELLSRWHQNGGILLISINLFRNVLTSETVSEPDQKAFHEYLLSPGPDMVIVDEGHLLKNDESVLNQCAIMIQTGRRIMLTGTPLQNNLTEYFVMMQFVKPNLLGNKPEFRNRFQNPIEHGQHTDSSLHDVKVMKRRIYVLTKMLQDCLHRCGYEVLTPFLEPKYEYVLSLKLTEEQIKLYRHYLEHFCEMVQKYLFRDKSVLEMIWTHPALLHHYYQECVKDRKRANYFVATIGDEWYKAIVNVDQIYRLELSAKFVLLFEVIKQCQKISDKLVIFSQSLLILNLIERFLSGQAHYRIDGSVPDRERTKIISKFNDSRGKVFLMLVSTRAGGIGVNLVGANRAVIFDASFNPANDVQAIFRIYRLGQTKPVYVYRFTSYGTMEDKIYKRQIVKLSLANRVVDEQQIERHYSKQDLTELFLLDTVYRQQPAIRLSQPNVNKDLILNELVAKHSDLIATIHEHDSLLIDHPEDELSDGEQKAAWNEFESGF